MNTFIHFDHRGKFITFNIINPTSTSPRDLSVRGRVDGPSEIHRDGQKIWFSSYRGFYRLDGPSRVHPNRHEWWVGATNKTKEFMTWCKNHEVDFDEIPEDMWLPLYFELY